jgi:plastocyanin
MRYVFAAAAFLLICAACGGSGSSATPSPRPSADVTIVAADRLFDLEMITVPDGSRVTITLRNEDADPHNIAIYESRAAEEEIFVSETITGPGKETEGSFDAPPEGEYFFRCDVHPVTMIGDFIVE